MLSINNHVLVLGGRLNIRHNNDDLMMQSNLEVHVSLHEFLNMFFIERTLKNGRPTFFDSNLSSESRILQLT